MLVQFTFFGAYFIGSFIYFIVSINKGDPYEKFHAKGFDILGVSLDKSADKAKWLNAIRSDGLTWTQVSDLGFWNNAAAKEYGVTSIPMNFLIDPKGKIVGKNLRGEDLEKKLGELFGE